MRNRSRLVATRGSLHILVVGPMVAGSTTAQRLQALSDLGHKTRAVTTVRANADDLVRPSFLERLHYKLCGPRDCAGANAAVGAAIREENFDIVWIDKGLTIGPETLSVIRTVQPRCRIVGFSPDDMMNRANQSRNFVRGLPLYHFYVTNKSFNVTELEALGCPKVLFMDNGYDPGTHRPMELTAGDHAGLGGPVGFIGQWESDRAESLRALSQAGVPVRVWGYTWERMKNVPAALTLENRPLWGDDYAQGICSFDINLCFLRKCNRDLQTTRSVEIPACRAFMLAERTDEHLRLFEEGREAEFFSSNEEMISKCRYYLDHPEERRRIAERGYERCLRDGYSYTARLHHVLDAIIKRDA